MLPTIYRVVIDDPCATKRRALYVPALTDEGALLLAGRLSLILDARGHLPMENPEAPLLRRLYHSLDSGYVADIVLMWTQSVVPLGGRPDAARTARAVTALLRRFVPDYAPARPWSVLP